MGTRRVNRPKAAARQDRRLEAQGSAFVLDLEALHAENATPEGQARLARSEASQAAHPCRRELVFTREDGREVCAWCGKPWEGA